MASDALSRILELPRVDYMDTSKFPDLTPKFLRADSEWHRKGRSLFTHQSATVYAAADMLTRNSTYRGVLSILPVGSGKTLAALLTGTALNAERIVYITRARLKDQVRREVYEDYAPNFYITPDVDVHSYSELSAQSASTQGQFEGRLYQWCHHKVSNPGKVLIVFDEIHRLGNPDAARTQRVLWDFLSMLVEGKSAAERPMMLGLTGSVVLESVKNMAHLFYMILGKFSPLPIYLPTKHPNPKNPFQSALIDPALDGWSQWLDRSARGSWKGSADMDRLIDAFGEPDDAVWAADDAAEDDPGEDWSIDEATVPEKDLAATVKMRLARRALSRRISTAPGVVMPTAGVESGTNANIMIHYIEEDELQLPEVCRRWLSDYRAGNVDETIYVCDDDNGESRILKTLACGFVNKWIWPEEMTDEDRVEWLASRSAWHRFVRSELQENISPGYDTEGHVRNYINGQLRSLKEDEWEDPHRVLHRWQTSMRNWGRTIPTEAEWVDEFLIDDVMKRVADADKKKQHLLVWYRSVGIMEKLKERGLKVWYGDDCDPKRDAGNSVGCSTSSHTEGLNLQYDWFRELIIEMPGAGITQQMFGRIHRTGQPQDFCEYYIYAHSEDLKKVIRSVKAAAVREYDLTTDPQKILIGKEF